MYDYDFIILFEKEELDKEYQHFLFSKNYCWESGEEFWQHYCQLPYYILIKNHRYIIGESNFKEYKAGHAGKVYTSEQFKRKYNKKLEI